MLDMSFTAMNARNFSKCFTKSGWRYLAVRVSVRRIESGTCRWSLVNGVARRAFGPNPRAEENPVGSWEDLATFLAALPAEDLALFSRYAAVEVPEEPHAVSATLRTYAAQNPAATASGLLATTGARAGSVRDLGFARAMGAAALELAETPEERQLAHVCLAQIHFQNRREEADLLAFEEHCRAAIGLGHGGTFCYERLAALYEYRGDLEEAAKICRRAVEALESSGDPRSAERFRRRLQRLSEKGSG
jgi:hypothetical protein